MTDAGIKTFSDLEAEVVDRGICGRCGGCVSFCSAGKLSALGLDNTGLPRYASQDRCLKCGICYMICPLTTDLDDEVKARQGWRPPIGAFEAIASARSTDSAVLESATDGGVVTSLLLYLLDRHQIDGAIVSRKLGPFSRQPGIVSSREDVMAAAGSHFAAVPHLEQLGEQYSTFSPTISAVKSLEGKRLGRVALVGTPCQVQTIRKMQSLSIVPSDAVSFVIGLFCMENFVFDAGVAESLLGSHGVSFADIVKLNVKDDVIVTLRDGTAHHVPFDEADRFARPACLACTEFANDYADVSVGGLGSIDGFTTTIIRTEKGRAVYGEALRKGYIEERQYRDSAERRADKSRMIAKVVDFARRKRERGQARRKELGIVGSARDE